MTAEPVIQEIWRLLQARREEMREHRRWLHQHAEISFQETETSRYIYEFYKKKKYAC